MKIHIIGLSKSGTTALFYLIKDSSKENIETIFERKALARKRELLESNNDVLLKMLLFPGALKKGEYDELVEISDKNILIIRDPRDNIISELLYYGGYHVTWSKSYEQRQKAIALLKEKEANSKIVSVIRLFEILCDRDREDLNQYMMKRYESVSEFVERYKNVEVVKYEDILQNSLHNLENYLGFSLAPKTQVKSDHAYVIRKKAEGDWKNWFTEEDIVFFKPILEKYMSQFEYPNDWTLSAQPGILAKYSSAYFEKLIENKRNSHRPDHPIKRLLKKLFS